MEDRLITAGTNEDVWDSLADNEQETANLQMLLAISRDRGSVEGQDVPAAHLLGLTRPRLNDLLRGKLSKYSLDAFINIVRAGRLNFEIPVKEAA